MASLLRERLLSEQGEIENSNFTVKGWARAAKGVSGDIFFIEPLDENNIFFKNKKK